VTFASSAALDLKRTFTYVLTGAYDGFGYHGCLPVPTVATTAGSCAAPA
jgi:hypothetical protein